MALDSLPEDIAYGILAHLSLEDIIRLRQVSKHFYSITHHRAVWANAYRTSTLPRPSGPLPFQPAKYLEETLIRTHRVDSNWLSLSPSPVSRRIISGFSELSLVDLVSGRWLVVCESRGIFCFDLDRPRDWDQPVAHYVRRFKRPAPLTTHRVFRGGHSYMYVAVYEVLASSTTLYLSKLPLTSPCPSFELLAEHLISKPFGRLLFHDKFLFSVGKKNIWAINLETLQQYNFPSETEERNASYYTITASHLIAMHVSETEQVSLEAFTLLDLDDSVPKLHRTHVGKGSLALTEGYLLCSPNTVQISDNTQTIIPLASLFQVNLFTSHLYLFDLTFIPSTPLGQITISKKSQVSLEHYSWGLSMASSNDGHARGILQCDTGFLGLTIRNTTGANPIEWRKMEVSDDVLDVAADGYRGRVCWVGGRVPGIHVVDYA